MHRCRCCLLLYPELSARCSVYMYMDFVPVSLVIFYALFQYDLKGFRPLISVYNFFSSSSNILSFWVLRRYGDLRLSTPMYILMFCQNWLGSFRLLDIIAICTRHSLNMLFTSLVSSQKLLYCPA